MTQEHDDARADPARAAHIATLVGRYPDVSAQEIQDLKSWFMREASALDVALLASRDDVRSGYSKFRKDHVDRFQLKEIVLASVIILAVLAGAIALGSLS